MAKIVIALGGNALGNTPEEQKKAVEIPAKVIVSLIKKGHNVLVGHGNGPQVGMIYNAFADAIKTNNKTPYIPFAEAGAMSQGYIGFHLQNSIANNLKKNNIEKDVLYFLTQTLVDKNDSAFLNPTKPVGSFYKSKQEALDACGSDSTIIEDSGRGYRKVVASPKPINFLSIKSIKDNFDKGNLVIVGGGGGIPTITNENDEYVGVDGVIDKDFALSKIASLINADILIILTAVPNVYINFKKENENKLENTSTAELKNYIKEGHFAAGSMLPKIEAAISFVETNKNNKAVIALLQDLENAVEGKAGTIISSK